MTSRKITYEEAKTLGHLAWLVRGEGFSHWYTNVPAR